MIAVILLHRALKLDILQVISHEILRLRKRNGFQSFIVKKIIKHLQQGWQRYPAIRLAGEEYKRTARPGAQHLLI